MARRKGRQQQKGGLTVKRMKRIQFFNERVSIANK